MLEITNEVSYEENLAYQTTQLGHVKPKKICSDFA